MYKSIITDPQHSRATCKSRPDQQEAPHLHSCIEAAGIEPLIEGRAQSAAVPKYSSMQARALLSCPGLLQSHS